MNVQAPSALPSDGQTMPSVPKSYLDRIGHLVAGHGRTLLGLVGPPGSGKSTLAQALHQAFPDVSVIVPMDGFHLAGAELRRLGLAGKKGAPETFDGAGYVALLRRIRAQRAAETVYAPQFHREIEEPIAGAIAVPPSTRLVITEGNYLLLNSGHWVDIAGLLDETWYVDIDSPLRVDRLVQRHVHFGRSPQAAEEWVRVNDEANARLIETTRARATVLFRW